MTWHALDLAVAIVVGVILGLLVAAIARRPGDSATAGPVDADPL